MSADGKNHSENNLNNYKASESLLEDKEIKHDSEVETKMFVPDKKYIKHRYFFSASLACGFLVFVSNLSFNNFDLFLLLFFSKYENF